MALKFVTDFFFHNSIILILALMRLRQYFVGLFCYLKYKGGTCKYLLSLMVNWCYKAFVKLFLLRFHKHLSCLLDGGL